MRQGVVSTVAIGHILRSVYNFIIWIWVILHADRWQHPTKFPSTQSTKITTISRWYSTPNSSNTPPAIPTSSAIFAKTVCSSKTCTSLPPKPKILLGQGSSENSSIILSGRGSTKSNLNIRSISNKCYSEDLLMLFGNPTLTINYWTGLPQFPSWSKKYSLSTQWTKKV